jgi:hypothetical protein
MRVRMSLIPLPCALLVLSSSCSSSDVSAAKSADGGALAIGSDAEALGTDSEPLGAGAADTSAIDACPPGAAVGDLPDDVATVLRAKCQACHRSPPREHAPFPLLTYEDTRASDPSAPYAGNPIWRVMYIVIQPNGVPHMPLTGAPQLTDAELQTLDGWLTACAMPVPEGTGGDVGSGAADAANPDDASTGTEAGEVGDSSTE